MELDGEPKSETLVDFKAECDKKDVIIADLKKKLGDYAKRTMVLINEKNELKRLLEESGKSNLTNQPLKNSPNSSSSPELLTSVQAGEIMGIDSPDGELINYQEEVKKRDKIILEMDAKFKEYVKEAMKIINERNELQKELDEIKQKTEKLETKEDKLEGVWKKKLQNAERKVRAVEKILEQKNKEISEFQSRYIGELTEKDKKIEEMVLKITKLEEELKAKE